MLFAEFEQQVPVVVTHCLQVSKHQLYLRVVCRHLDLRNLRTCIELTDQLRKLFEFMPYLG